MWNNTQWGFQMVTSWLDSAVTRYLSICIIIISFEFGRELRMRSPSPPITAAAARARARVFARFTTVLNVPESSFDYGGDLFFKREQTPIKQWRQYNLI